MKNRLLHEEPLAPGARMAKKLQQILDIPLAFLGALAGGLLGYYTFQWLYYHGFYGMMIPGALIGLGSGLLTQAPSKARGFVCAATAMGQSVLMEWKFFPFIASSRFRYFVRHFLEVNSVHLAMIAAGAFFAYWLAKDAGFRGRSTRHGVSARID
ncbi:MAG: hypothetical protein ACLP7Q_12465 [Isosphaeraceae bacterium]